MLFLVLLALVLNVTLNFVADGSYELVEQYQGTDGTTFNTQGQATYGCRDSCSDLNINLMARRLMKWENNQLFYIDTVGNALSDYYVIKSTIINTLNNIIGRDTL